MGRVRIHHCSIFALRHFCDPNEVRLSQSNKVRPAIRDHRVAHLEQRAGHAHKLHVERIGNRRQLDHGRIFGAALIVGFRRMNEREHEIPDSAQDGHDR